MFEDKYSHSENVHLKITSVSIPFILRMNLLSNNKVFIDFETQADLFYAAKREGTYHGIVFYNNMSRFRDTQYYFQESYYLRPLTLNFSVGVGYSFSLFDQDFDLKFNYYYNLIRYDRTYYTNNEVSNSFLRLSFGLKFPLRMRITEYQGNYY